jgi:hypothetical protein
VRCHAHGVNPCNFQIAFVDHYTYDLEGHRRITYGMTLLSYAVLFLLPLLSFVALARAMDEESPWRLRDAISFNVVLFSIGAAMLAVLEVAT